MSFKYSLVPRLAGSVQRQAETVRVGLLLEAMDVVDLLSVSLSSVEDVATVAIVSSDTKEAEKPHSVLKEQLVGLLARGERRVKKHTTLYIL